MRVLKARMNADLHMATDLKQTDAGNLFVVFGEPDIRIHDAPDDEISVEIKGVDVFDPAKGEVRSDDADGIACCSSTPTTTRRAFRSPRVLPGCEGSIQEPEDLSQGRNRRGGVGIAPQGAITALRQAADGRIAVKVINHLGMRR